MDCSKINRSIAETLKKAGSPLTEDQEMLLAGCLAVWIEKAHEEGRLDQAKLELAGRDMFFDRLRNNLREALSATLKKEPDEAARLLRNMIGA